MPTNVHYNGSVEPIFTTFTFRGPAAEVARLLSELTERLGRIDAAAVDHEARVLAQEERVRGGGGLDSALAYRWGARGPGVFWFRQFGLNRPDPELLRAAAGRWFVRQNAALALDGPLPDGLRLSLPQGQAQPVRLPAPARWLPAAAPDDRAVVTGLAPSGLAAAITLGIVGSRLNRGLRTAGAPPDWSTDYLRLGDTAHLALMAPEGDGQAEHAAGAVGILQQVAGYGPAPAEVDEYRSLQEQLWLDRDATWSAPWQEAEARLLGRPRQTADSWRAELDAVAARIAAARGEQRGLDPAAEAAYWRYGPVGLGASAWDPSPGPWTATLNGLREYAGEVFTLTNAVLVMDGPPPATLAVPLPTGEGRLPIPRAEPVIGLPSSYPAEGGGVHFSGIGPRSMPARVATRVVEHRIADRLRHGEGVSYSPIAGYVPAVNDATFNLAVDLQPGTETAACQAIVEVLDDLRTNGPTPVELDEHRAAAVQSLTDPRSARPRIFAHATDDLLGRPQQTTDDLLDELRATSPEAISRAVVGWQETGLLGLPREARAPARFPGIPTVFNDPPLGFESTIFDQPENDGDALQHDGTTVRLYGRRHSTAIRHAEAVGYFAWADGRRLLLGPQGRRIDIEPVTWSNGQALVALLDQAVDPGITIPLPARAPRERPPSPGLIRLHQRIEERLALRSYLSRLLPAIAVVFVALEFLVREVMAGYAQNRPWAVLIMGVVLTVLVAAARALLARQLARLGQQLAEFS